MQRKATVSAGDAAGDAAAAAGSLSALSQSGAPAVTFAAMRSVSESLSPFSGQEQGMGRMPSTDGYEVPSLPLPPCMPAMGRMHSLTLPGHSRSLSNGSSYGSLSRNPSLTRTPSESSVDSLSRIPSIGRISTADMNAFGDQDPILSRNLSSTSDGMGSLSMSRTSSLESVSPSSVAVQTAAGQRMLPASLALSQQLRTGQPTGATPRSPADILASFLSPKSYNQVQERAADPRPPAANTTKTRTKRRANGKAKKESAAKTTKTTKKKEWICTFVNPKTKKQCGKKFTIKAKLTAHDRTHSGDRPFKCKIAGCNKRFASAATRTAHQKSAAHTSERSYKCEWVDPVTGIKCTKAYTHSRSLIEHTCKHTGEWLHECPTCGRRFTVNSNYKRHRDTVDCAAIMERKRKKEVKEAAKKARRAAKEAAKVAKKRSTGGASKRSRRS